MNDKHINDGGPAFPFGQISEVTGQPVNGFYDPGMSLRDYFAARAMQSMIAKYGFSSGEINFAAEQSYIVADAMLAARDMDRGK